MKAKPFSLLLVIFLFISLACKISGIGGGRDVSISDPTAGLSDLPAYRASLVYGFTGTQDGEPSNWSQTYILSVVKDSQTRLLEYTETGLDPEWTPFPFFAGHQSDIIYTRYNSLDTCSATYADESYDPSWMVEPAARLLPVIQLDGSGENEFITGIETTKFELDASSLIKETTAEASGAVWMANEGGYIVKYSLEISGDKQVFGEGMSGTLSWEYQLELLDPSDSSILPADCPRELPDLPTMEDASEIIKFPGYTSYMTGSNQEEVLEFHRTSLVDLGYTETGVITIDDTSTFMTFTNDSGEILVYVETGVLTKVLISGRTNLADAPVPTFEPVATVSGDDPQVRVLNAIDKLVGGGSTVPAFPSYHMEYSLSAPVWSGGIVQSTQQISADVEGKNVHFIENASGARNEVYIIDGQEYEVIGGTASPGFGLASLSWSMWYIDPVMIISIASLDTTLTGTETLEGRTVEVYELSGNSADDTSGYMSGLGVTLTRTAGTMWVDQETGGLVKAVFEYDEDIKDDSGTVKGNAGGNFEIVVTEIGTVSVSLP